MPRKKPKTKASKRRKMAKVMREFKEGDLHSGAKDGPIVTSLGQALAISLSESGQSKRKWRRRKK